MDTTIARRSRLASPFGGGTVGPLLAVGLLVAAAWSVAVILEVTGRAAALHHHALIEPGAPPLWLGVPAFVVAWLLMVAAMMLPASLRAIEMAVAGPGSAPSPRGALVGFLAAYGLVWTGFGLIAFVGDMGLHALVHASPWLAARPWLIEAAVMALAGAYQLAPIKRRGLEACRHPQPVATRAAVRASESRLGFRAGLDHGIDCVASSWALMLLMFAAGVANLAWMAVLTVAMAYEARGRFGRQAALGFGLALLWLALIAATGVVIAF